MVLEVNFCEGGEITYHREDVYHQIYTPQHIGCLHNINVMGTEKYGKTVRRSALFSIKGKWQTTV